MVSKTTFQDTYAVCTRRDALHKLSSFTPGMRRYDNTRNHVLRDHRNVSLLSAEVRCRLLLEWELIEEAAKKYSFAATQKWVQEVCWRLYWKGWLEWRPEVWQRYRERCHQLKLELTEEQNIRISAITQGQSGVVVMDRFVDELIAKGYMHNHARMWFASFWIHSEHLPWELGAQFLYRHLLDADPASNTLSWRWVAGLQTKGKFYLARRSNIEKFCDASWFSPIGLEKLENPQAVEIQETALLEFIEPVEPEKSHALTQAQTTLRSGLWLHGEDLCLESSPLAKVKPGSLKAFLANHLFSAYETSDLRRAYAKAVLQDGLARASEHFQVDGGLFETDNLGGELASWALEDKLDCILAMRPHVGPLHDQLEEIRGALQKVGVDLILIRRPQDEETSAYAQRGFFAYWKRMSKIIEDRFW
ncbi:MAG: FAD-binding domain-containing protein [Verrucomicrobiota bacterium]